MDVVGWIHMRQSWVGRLDTWRVELVGVTSYLQVVSLLDVGNIVVVECCRLLKPKLFIDQCWYIGLKPLGSQNYS